MVVLDSVRTVRGGDRASRTSGRGGWIAAAEASLTTRRISTASITAGKTHCRSASDTSTSITPTNTTSTCSGRGRCFNFCRARTRLGEDTLAAWLRTAASPSAIDFRQRAISELHGRVDLREALALLPAEVHDSIDQSLLHDWASRALVFCHEHCW